MDHGSISGSTVILTHTGRAKVANWLASSKRMKRVSEKTLKNNDIHALGRLVVHMMSTSFNFVDKKKLPEGSDNCSASARNFVEATLFVEPVDLEKVRVILMT